MNESFFRYVLAKYVVLPVLERKGIAIIFVKGDSGVGKTSFCVYLGLTLTALMSELFRDRERGFKKKLSPETFETIKNFFDNPEFDLKKQIVYEPFEYKPKLEWFLNNPHPVFIIDELRFLVPAKLWRDIISLTFADINATIRAVKARKFGYGGIFIYNSQFFSDIIKDTRRTVKFVFDLRMNPDDLKTYGYLLINFERKYGDSYIQSEKKPRVETVMELLTLGAIYTTKLPDAIDRELEVLSSEAKARINRMKQEKLEKELMKHFGIKG